ncbi:MAG: TetR/AcrR family transcriptional regulator [Ardenticatenaceae bacterium]|nr:TetR/AcrR family transcriptional regulator [Ardenticatenaceae bacterium]
MDELTPRERRHLRTREAVLEAARQIVSEQGADALSIRAIADRIDYSPAGLYEYFGSKEEIITAVCRQGHERLTQVMTAVDPTRPADEYLIAIGQAYIQFALDNPDYYRLMFTNPTFVGTPERMQEYGSSFTILLAAIQRGLDEGAFRPRPGYATLEMAYTAWALVHGISMLRLTYLTHHPIDYDTADAEALRSLVHGLTQA